MLYCNNKLIVMLPLIESTRVCLIVTIYFNRKEKISNMLLRY